jgi:predicted SprT family Zn-dependent metalloprotease
MDYANLRLLNKFLLSKTNDTYKKLSVYICQCQTRFQRKKKNTLTETGNVEFEDFILDFVYE